MPKSSLLRFAAALSITLLSTPIYAQITNVCGPITLDNPINYSFFTRIASQIVNQMTLDQKIGQMTLTDFTLLPARSDHYLEPGAINNSLIRQFNVGGVLVAGDGTPLNCKNNQCDLVANALLPHIYENATLNNWQQLAAGVNSQPTVIGPNPKHAVYIFPLLGTDAVHGNQHVLGSVLFPQNIGLAATHDPKVFYQAGFWTGQSVQKSGFNWAFAPTVAISHNPNWGRFYETMGSSLTQVRDYAYCFNHGLQQSRQGFITGVLASTKHYIGDGATVDGIDEGNVEVHDFNRFFKVNGAGYEEAILAGTGSVMITYSGVNNVALTTNVPLLQSLTTGRYNGVKYYEPFRGLVVSDYGAINKAATQGLPTTTHKTTYSEALATSINGGMDMIMLSPWPDNASIVNFQATLKQLVLNSTNGGFPSIPVQRINEAVTRILAVKYAMGLIQDVHGNKWETIIPGINLFRNHDKNNDKAAKDALNAAEKSLVLLKNTNTLLPLNIHSLKYIVLVGENTFNVRQEDGSTKVEVFQNFNNIGAQNGGWSIRWQGFNGNEYWQGENKKLSHATSLLDGITSLNKDKKTQLLYPEASWDPTARQAFLDNLKTQYADMTSSNTVIIATLAEPPYAEFMGDINVPYCRNNPTDSNNGCLYNIHANAYLPDQQKPTLAVKLDTFSEQIINTIHLKNSTIPVVTVLLSGRPVIITEPSNGAQGFIPLENSQAFIAAWWPGTTGGQAIANALFGKYHFCKGSCSSDSANTLPVDWVANMEQLKDYPVYDKGRGIPRYEGPLFEEGFGLATRPR
jgi:beta-glucosidase